MTASSCRAVGLSAWFGVFLLSAGATGFAETYTVKDLGVLGNCESVASSLNSLGQVAGRSADSSFASNVFVTGDDGASMRSLGRESTGHAPQINDTGWVTQGPRVYDPRSKAWFSPVLAPTPHFPAGAGTVLFGLSPSARLTGFLLTPFASAHPPHALISAENGGELTDLNDIVVPTDKDPSFVGGSIGMAINVEDRVTGTVDTIEGPRAFLTDRGGAGPVQYLPPYGPNPAFPVIPRAINDRGDVVGYIATTLSVAHRAFLSRGGSEMLDLGAMDGVSSRANGINAARQIVGQVVLAGGSRRAFIWDESSAMRDLNTLISPSAGWTLTDAVAINDRGQIAANGDSPSFPSGCQHALLLTPVATEKPCEDRDKDGLCDEWEVDGVKNDRGEVILDLRAMGASPDHKDIFVFVDYLEDSSPAWKGGHSHRPDSLAIEWVKAAFANAPADLVDNPDRRPGIALHVEYAPRPLSESAFGLDLSRAYGCSPESESAIGKCAIDALAQARKDRLPVSYRGVFHYALFAHQFSVNIACLGVRSGMTGFAPGDADLAVTMTPFWNGWLAANGSLPKVVRLYSEAGTFMHELGHALKLQHGGPGDDTNRKPNYLSVMNYLWQVTGLTDRSRPDPVLDFSREVLPSMDESRLSEGSGVQADRTGHYANYLTKFLCPTMSPADKEEEPRSVTLNGAADFNCDGRIEAATVTDANVNNDFEGEFCGTKPRIGILRGANDWRSLVLANGSIGKPLLGVAPSAGILSPERPFSESEITSMARTMQSMPFQLTLKTASPYFFVGKGRARTIDFLLKNVGLERDRYALRTRSTHGFADFGGVPSVVSLAPGEEVILPVTLRAPAAGLRESVEVSLTPISESHDTSFEALSVRFHAKGDVNGDGRVNRDDLSELNARLNTAACDRTSLPCRPGDEVSRVYDLNGDGKVNALDARLLVLECTKARCAK